MKDDPTLNNLLSEVKNGIHSKETFVHDSKQNLKNPAYRAELHRLLDKAAEDGSGVTQEEWDNLQKLL